MKKILIFILGLLLACTALACQPSPHDDIIINKGDSELSLEEMFAADPVPFVPIDAPERVERAGKERNGVSVSFNAEVQIPEVDAYRIALIEKWEFDDESILKWANLFADGAALLAETEKTKADYEKDMANLLTALEEAEKRQDVDTADYLREEMLAMNQLGALAPEDVPPKAFSLADYQQSANLTIKIEDSEAKLITKRGGQSFLFRSREDVFLYPESFYPLHPSDATEQDKRWKKIMDTDYDFLPEEAIEMAQGALDALALNGFSLSSLEKCCVITIYQMLLGKGYYLEYTRNNNGLSGYRDIVTTTFEKVMPVVGSPWGVEHISFVIDETGIRLMDAVALGMETAIVSENTELLSFEKILECIESKLHQMWILGAYDDRIELAIDKIELRSALVSAKNESDCGINIPVWHFSIQCRYYQADYVISETVPLTLDARDGAYIEPMLLTSELASYVG